MVGVFYRPTAPEGEKIIDTGFLALRSITKIHQRPLQNSKLWKFKPSNKLFYAHYVAEGSLFSKSFKKQETFDSNVELCKGLHQVSSSMGSLSPNGGIVS